jgi:NTE family protein
MKWSLVLSGGGALGMAHLGVLKVLDGEGYIPDLIAGTSMGAIIGALWANGSSVREMEDIAREINIMDFQEGMTFRIPFNNPVTRFLQAEEALGILVKEKGINNGLKIRSFLDEIFKGNTFQDTRIPFYCNAVDLLKGNEIVIHDGLLSDGTYASMAYPGFFSPLERPDSLLCDGSVINNYPVWIAREFGPSRVLGIDVGAYKTASRSELNNALAILFRSYLTSCQTQKRTGKDRANLTLHIKSDRSSFNFENIEACIRRGEEAAMARLKDIKKALTCPLPGKRILEA